MIPRPTIVAKDRVHLGELIEQELASQGMAADLNHIDVSHVQDFDILFQDVPFNGDISRWDVSRVTSMGRMFENSAFNGDISVWDVSNVCSMYEMFKGGNFGGDLSRWDTRNVTSMESMFRGPNNRPTGLSKWNVSSVESFFRMFKNSICTEDLSRWSPREGAYAEAMLDRPSLVNTPKPSFYHWYRVLGDAQNGPTMPEHLLVPPQGLDCLRPEWAEHFNAMLPLAKGLGLSGMALPCFIQEQWLERQGPTSETWTLPALDMP